MFQIIFLIRMFIRIKNKMKNLNFKSKEDTSNLKTNNYENFQKLTDQNYHKNKEKFSYKENIEVKTDLYLSNKLSQLKDIKIKNSFFAKNFEDSGEENISSSENNHNLELIQNKIFKNKN